MNIKLVHSFKFSSSLLLIPSSTKLIAGTRDGMVCIALNLFINFRDYELIILLLATR